MQSVFLILPFQIFLIIIGFFLLVSASIFLVRNLRKMQREHKEGITFIWYQQFKVRASLNWIGYALMVLLFAFGWSIINLLSRDIAIISIISVAFVVISIYVVMISSHLLRALRNLRWERREGFLLIWRRPKILKQIGWILFWCGPLLDFAYLDYVLLVQAILHFPFPENTAPLIFIPSMFSLLSAVFYFYAVFLEVLNRRSY